MMEWIDLLRQTMGDNLPWGRNILASIAAAAAVVGLRWFLATRVRKSAIRSPELRQRWLVSVRNGCFLLLLVGLVSIWSNELQQLAISLLAILVALVLATKELILCLTGSILKMRSGSFSIGDRIEVNGIRGDVIDQTLLTTRLAELNASPGGSQYTGRSVTLPNSLFLTSSVANASALGSFSLHTIVVPVAASEDVIAAENRLLVAARDVSSPYLEEARAAIDKQVSRQGLEPPDVEPRVTLTLVDPARVDLALRLAVPARHARRVEQDILRVYLKQTRQDATVGEDVSTD